MDSNSDIEFDLCVGVGVRASVRACVRVGVCFMPLDYSERVQYANIYRI